MGTESVKERGNKKMKKTNMLICVGKKNGYDIYRVVFKNGEHYFIKYKNCLINVDTDVRNGEYTYKS